MSITEIANLVKRGVINSTQALVLQLVVNGMGDKHHIADATGYSIRTIETACAVLARVGLVTKDGLALVAQNPALEDDIYISTSTNNNSSSGAESCAREVCEKTDKPMRVGWLTKRIVRIIPAEFDRWDELQKSLVVALQRVEKQRNRIVCYEAYLCRVVDNAILSVVEAKPKAQVVDLTATIYNGHVKRMIELGYSIDEAQDMAAGELQRRGLSN